MMYKIVKEKYLIGKVILVTGFSVILLAFSGYSKAGASRGLYLSAEVLIPSLFPFMVLASFCVKSGVSDYLGKFMSFFTKGVFGVSECCGATILLSLFGGFPVGAKGISALYESGRISKNEAEKLAYSLVCAGPGFLLVFIGTTLLNDKKIGFCILASQIISVIIIGFINKLIFIKDEHLISQKEFSKSALSTYEALISSVRDCTYGLLEMCGIVVVFSSFSSILENLFLNNHNLYTYSISLFEVTTASSFLCGQGNIEMLAFAIGFGGFSVHFQIFQALKNIKFNKLLFIFYRLIQGIITAFLTGLFIRIFNISLPVYSSISNIEFTLSTSVLGSILLLVTGLCFLYTLKNYKTNGGL